MPEKYEVRNPAGKLLGTAERVEKPAELDLPSSEGNGILALLVGVPRDSAIAGLAAFLLGSLLIHIGSPVAAACAKAFGASPKFVASLLAADSWSIGKSIGWFTFYTAFPILFIRWLRKGENSAVLILMLVLFAIFAFLLAVWKSLATYAASS